VWTFQLREKSVTPNVTQPHIVEDKVTTQTTASHLPIFKWAVVNKTQTERLTSRSRHKKFVLVSAKGIVYSMRARIGVWFIRPLNWVGGGGY
jgi:hypothetical protein